MLTKVGKHSLSNLTESKLSTYVLIELVPLTLLS